MSLPPARRLALASGLTFLVVQNLLFVRRAVLATPPPWDPALYLFMSLRYWHALTEQGFGALWREVQDVTLSPYVPPLLPLSALPLYGAFGASRLAAYATSSLYLCLLLAGTWFLARARDGEGAGGLALFLAATFSSTVNLSRDYQMDLPAAALLTLGVCALLRSEGFRRRGWSAAFGALAGLALLAKTMSGAFFAGPAAVALLRSWRAREARGRVLLDLGIALGAAAFIASAWWATHVTRAVWYLFYYGWGPGADPYAAGGSAGLLTLRSLGFYLVALANDGASVPCMLLAAALLAAGAWRRFGRGPAPARPGDAITPLAWAWLLAGYALLSLSRNKTADRYVVFLVPPVAILMAGAIARLPRGTGRRVALFAALLMGAANYVAWTWPETGLRLLAWRPPFALVAYRPHQPWLRSEAGLAEGEWPLAPIVATLARLREPAKARLLPTLLAQGLAEAEAASPEERVGAAYRGVLRREPDALGLAAYSRQLRDGVTSPAQLLGRLAASDEFRDRPLRVLVVPDHPFLNRSTLRYFAEAARAPVVFAGVDPGHAGPWPIQDYDALLVKQGGYQGPAFATRHVPWVEARLGEAGAGFERQPESFPCPDGSRVVVFVYGAW